MKEQQSPRRVRIIGAGMGSLRLLTGEAGTAVKEAQALMGARRIVEALRPLNEGCPVLVSYRPEEMADWLEGFDWQEAVLAVSGDTGFYSGAAGAGEAFRKKGWKVELIPGISSLSWFAAAIGKPWQDMAVLSCHGRQADGAKWIAEHGLSFLLMGDLGKLLEQLEEKGCKDLHLWAGENFSGPQERIVEGDVSGLKEIHRRHPFGPLCCVIAENPFPQKETAAVPAWGLPDEAFLRGKAPMTKSEIRAVSMSKLALRPGAVCYDIGSGTGSVAVEMGLTLKHAGGQVYAVEYKPEALQLTRENAERLLGDWSGFHVVEGRAPEALKELPAPTHAFLGGSGGELQEIVRHLLEKNPQVRIGADAITPETLAQLTECRSRFAFSRWEMVQVSVTAYHPVGDYRMPRAGNPVYIVVMEGGQAECTDG